MTPQGLAINAAIGQKAVQVEQHLLEGFSPAERILLREWLQRMTNNLGPVHEDICP